MNYASFGKRFLAMLIDGLVVSFLGGFIAMMFGYEFYLIFGGLFSALYFILCEGSNAHATLGKRAMGIMVADASGGGIGYGKATGRYFGKILSSLTLLIGYLIALGSPTMQTLHDRLAGTFVLDVKNGAPVPQNQMDFVREEPQMYSRSIVGITGEFAGRSFPITANGLVFGRDPITCQVIFPESTPGVSRHHCHIQFNPQTNLFILNDMGSSNGTFTMNSIRLVQGQTVALKSGERFYLGSQNITFETR